MKRFLALLLFAPPVFSQTVIPIQNPSFELPTNLPDSNSCGQSTYQNIPGWTFTQPSGTAYGVIAWTCGPIPDGKQVAFLIGSSMSQDLGILPQAGTYTLRVSIANWFYFYEGGYTISLTIKGKPVCTVSGYALGDFTEYPLVCTIDGHIAIDHNNFPAGNLGITVSNSIEWPILIDKFSLTFVQAN